METTSLLVELQPFAWPVAFVLAAGLLVSLLRAPKQPAPPVTFAALDVDLAIGNIKDGIVSNQKWIEHYNKKGGDGIIESTCVGSKKQSENAIERAKHVITILESYRRMLEEAKVKS